MASRKDTTRGQGLSATTTLRRWSAAALLCFFLAPARVPAADLQILVDVNAAGVPSPAAIDALLSGLPDDLAVSLTQIGQAAGGEPVIQLQRASRSNAPSLAAGLEALLTRWRKPSSDERLVIIVSGACDNADCSVDSAAHTKIAAELLPRLRQSGATLYTLAPPGRADQSLLQQLAVATGGWYRAAADTAQVTSGLTRYLDSIARRDLLPLEDGLLRIDDSVDRVSLLIPRSDPNLPPRLTPPLKMAFSRFNAPNNVSWRQEADITAVTMTKPLRGTWQVDGGAEPSARARAVGSLRLVVTPLPANLLLPASQTLQIELQNGGKRITDRAVLDHVAVKVTQYKDGTASRLWFPLDDGRDGDETPDDGIYTVPLNDSLVEGEHELVVDVEGLGFQRQHRQLTVVNKYPAAAFWQPLAPDRFRISVVPRAGMINPDMMSVRANLVVASADAQELQVPRFTTTEWRTDVTAPKGIEKFTIELNVVGSTPEGKPISIWLDPLALRAAPVNVASPAREPSALTTTQPATASPQSVAEHSVARHSEPAEHDRAAPSNAAGTGRHAAEDPPNPGAGSMLRVIAELTLSNLLLIAVGAGATVMWRRSQQRWRKTIEDAIAHG